MVDLAGTNKMELKIAALVQGQHGTYFIIHKDKLGLFALGYGKPQVANPKSIIH